MASISVTTHKPDYFLNSLVPKIKGGKIPNWMMVDETDDQRFTLLERKAWIVIVSASNGELSFDFGLPNGTDIDRKLYEKYTNDFAEMLQDHFSDLVIEIKIEPFSTS